MIVPSLHDLTTKMFVVSKWQLDTITKPELKKIINSWFSKYVENSMKGYRICDSNAPILLVLTI